MFKGVDGPLVLVILDGVGEISRQEGNAVRLASMPFYNSLKESQKFTTLKAHGTAVGLPSNKDMGNSEVGHNALGSGQVYDQGAKLVADAISSGKMFAGETWQTAVKKVKDGRKTLHFMGLLSDGNVHSHIEHLLAMLDRASEEGVTRVRIHCLYDGRDVAGVSAHIYVNQLEEKLEALRNKGFDYCIASAGGRMVITMDRYEADWEMVEKGWHHHVLGEGRAFPNAMKGLEVMREENEGIIDQDIPPYIIEKNGEPVGPIVDGDAVLFFNFRGDRAVEISQAFEYAEEFKAFNRVRVPDVYYAGMMQYDGDLHLPKNFLVGPPSIQDTLTHYLAEAKVHQFAISETQKYGHVTYFWNGNRSGKIDPGTEDYAEITSDRVPFDQRPWMKAAEITDRLIAEVKGGKHRFLRVNYANGDMVGHTGNLDAAIIAMSCVDLQLTRLFKAVREAHGVALITADHGNCDEMYEFEGDQVKKDEEGKWLVKTSHTLSPVPFLIYDPHFQVPGRLIEGGHFGIASIAATVSQLLGLEAPKNWEPSLLSFPGA